VLVIAQEFEIILCRIEQPVLKLQQLGNRGQGSGLESRPLSAILRVRWYQKGGVAGSKRKMHSQATLIGTCSPIGESWLGDLTADN
jgi:hypothetical protein